MKWWLFALIVVSVLQLSESQFSRQICSYDSAYFPNTLRTGQQLVSPLGKYKATLSGQNCQLLIYSFNEFNNTYTKVDSYQSPNSNIKDCEGLIVLKNGRVQADHSSVAKDNREDYASEKESQNPQNYQWARSQQVCLSIDDNGKLTLAGFYQVKNGENNTGQQQSLLQQLPETGLYQLYSPGQASTPNNIIATSSLSLPVLTTQFTNTNGWFFEIASGKLIISKGAKSKEFSLEGIKLKPSGLYDQSNRGIALASFEHAMNQERCGDLSGTIKRKNSQLKSPYAIEMDRNWPRVRIYDAEVYLIAQYDISEQHPFEQTHICPKATMMFKGECRSACPNPYFAHINSAHAQCVLTCPIGSFSNSKTRTCSCNQDELTGNKVDSNLIKKCERQWETTFYGCNCSKIKNKDGAALFYDRQRTLSCQKGTLNQYLDCAQGSIAIDGVCMDCEPNCLRCSKDTDFTRFLTCNQCIEGYALNSGGKCTNTNLRNAKICQQSNCQQCTGSQCTRCSPFYSLKQGACVLSCGTGYTLVHQTGAVQAASECISNDVVTSEQSASTSCYVGCISCSSSPNVCLACAPGYFLFVTPLSSTCRTLSSSSSFSCSPPDYSYDSTRKVCRVKNLADLMMDKCLQKIQNCLSCQYNSDNICVLCLPGFFMHQNKCQAQCPEGYFANEFSNVCVPTIANCQEHRLQQTGTASATDIDLSIIQGSQAYKRYISGGIDPVNQKAGYMIYKKNYILQEDISNESSIYQAYIANDQPASICLKCRRGYGLSGDRKSCSRCPSTCEYSYCYYAREDSCYQPTRPCTFLNQADKCMESCPEGLLPSIDRANVRRCLPQSLSSVRDYIKMDSSSYLQGDGSKIYYFVMDQAVQGSENVPIQASQLQIVGRGQSRRLIETSNVASLQKGQFFNVRETTEDAVALMFGQQTKGLRTASGQTLANSVYGAQLEETHNQWMRGWLAFIGYVLGIVVLLLHCLYVGNSLLYKVDNLLLLCQTIFFFSWVHLLVGNHLAMYYHGWGYSHVAFWPNYFISCIPNQYDEQSATLPFKLNNLDGNLLRNAGFAFSLLLTFLAAWILVVMVIFLLSKVLRKQEIWFPRIAKNSLIAAFELLSMIIFFFSITQLMHSYDIKPQTQQAISFNNVNFIFAIILIVLISVYALVRLLFNKIGGLYMIKRLAIASVLADAYQNPGYLAILVAIELLFTLGRFIFEKPRLLREKIYLLAEELLIILVYFLLFLVTLAAFNVLAITIIIIILMLFLIADLVDTYLEARNECYDTDIFGRKFDNAAQSAKDVLFAQGPGDSERKMI